MKNASISNCRGAIAGVLYATGSSKVEILENTTIEDSYSSAGDTILASLAQSVTISGARFTRNSRSDIYLDQTSGFINNSYF